MKSKILLTLLVSLPMAAFAQNNSQALQQVRNMHQQMDAQNKKWAGERAIADQHWRMQSMNSKLLNKIQAAENKLEKEEKNRKKLEEKSEELNTDLKTKQEELTALESKSKNSNDPGLQKDIDKLKKDISKAGEKITKNNSEIEDSLNKTDEYKKTIDAPKLEKENQRKKMEEEKKQNLMEKELKRSFNN